MCFWIRSASSVFGSFTAIFHFFFSVSTVSQIFNIPDGQVSWLRRSLQDTFCEWSNENSSAHPENHCETKHLNQYDDSLYLPLPTRSTKHGHPVFIEPWLSVLWSFPPFFTFFLPLLSPLLPLSLPLSLFSFFFLATERYGMDTRQ